jgi:SAM-dependent methyltransferase
MKLNIGSSGRAVPGFTGVDVRPNGPDVKRGHAGNLGFAPDNSVEVLFSHAVFEHVFRAHQLKVLREWQRVLAPGGTIVTIGLGDFEAIARLYFDGAPGVYSDRFDLHHVYRFTHGDPEMEAAPIWSRWDPAKRPNDAPHAFIPQLHKALFDSTYVALLLEEVHLQAHQFSYVFAGEEHRHNLGFVGGGASIEDGLSLIPGIEDYVRLETVEPVTARWHSEMSLGVVKQLDATLAPSRLRTMAGQIKRRIKR